MTSEKGDQVDWKAAWQTSPWVTGWRSHLLTGGLALLALSAGAALTRWLPDPQAIRQEPYFRAVSRNASVNLRTGSVNVVGLNAAPEIRDAFSTARSQHGTFLVVDVEYTALNRPGVLTNLLVETEDGRLFGGSPPAGSGSCGVAQPGIALSCQVVFEVDKVALQGARLRIPADVRGDGRGDDMALIDLSIDAALAKDLAGRQTPITVRPAQVQER